MSLFDFMVGVLLLLLLVWVFWFLLRRFLILSVVLAIVTFVVLIVAESIFGIFPAILLLGLLVLVSLTWYVSRSALVVGAVAAAVIAVPLLALVIGSGNNDQVITHTATQKQAIATVPEVDSLDLQPVNQNGEWSRHYYQNDPRVPGGYFGPACLPRKHNGRFVIESTDRCKQELAERLKRDPLLLSVMADEFNLLPEGMSQVEFAREARKESVRREYQPKVEAVLESLQNLKFVPLQGMYYTTYLDSRGRVRQARKRMDPSRHIAMEGSTPDGRLHRLKTDCGFQPTRKAPIPNVPVVRRQPPKPPVVQPPAFVQPPAPSQRIVEQRPKCQGGGICGTPTTGKEQNVRTDPGRTSGAPSRPAETTSRGRQQGGGGDLSGRTPSASGTDTGSPQGGAQGQAGADETTGQQGGSSIITAPPAPPPNQAPAIGDPCGGEPDNCG